jgi:8-oxo-dGTP diphosphatase
MSFRTWLERQQKIVAAVVLINNGRALILKRGPTAPWNPNLWNLPGGTAEPGEDPEETAARECEEESGITPVGMRYLKFFANVQFDFYVYVSEVDTDAVKLDWEHSDYKWITKKEISQYQFVPHVREALFMVL